MTRSTLGLISLLAIWLSLIFIPHFQQPGSLIFLFLGLFIMLSAYAATFHAFDFKVRQISWPAYSFLVVAIFAVIFLTLLGMNFPYLGFSRLGSYTMFLDSEVTLFGDLKHLTSAANCKGEIRVGQILCDPWNRPLNQNPDVIRFFRFASITNGLLLGLFSLCAWAITLYFLLRKFASKSLIVWSMCLTPPMVLAIDRGNEIITLSLICFSILLFYRFQSQNIFLIPLLFASVFKLWPFILLIWLILFLSRVKKHQKIFFLSLVFLYLALHLSDFRLLSKYTQQGSISGGSFGLSLIFHNGFYSVTLIIFIVVLSLLLLLGTPRDLLSFTYPNQEESWILGLMITYISLFLTGPHFNYRLIILVPLSVILVKIDGSKPLLVFIFVSLLTSRLSIVVVTTATLSILFMVLILDRFVNFFLQRLRIESK
jgi:hypothetical protein